VKTPVRVSVVLPVWNGERFLVEAVESVLAQTLEGIELLLVDDGSTDATADIARGFAARDERVRLIETKRRGIAHALNAGIATARAPYVARMDADDICHPERLQKQVAHLDAHPDCVAVGSAIEVIDETGEHVGTRTFPEDHASIARTLINGRWTAIAHPTVVARRDVLVSIGCYRAHTVPSEDLDLWFRLSRVGKLANIRERLLRYRRHANSVGARDRDRQWEVGMRIINDARRSEGLEPLADRVAPAHRGRLAAYHFECARTALLTGSRRMAIRHARATIAAEPSWPDPYVTLLACAFPKWTLRYLLGISGRLHSPHFEDR
jgi:hypothetical protein